MLPLLRVRRAARLRRRPELDGASRPLHRAGSWQPSFCECKAIPLADAAHLFSTEERQYAFGELDDAAKNRLATFAADYRCTPDSRPTEGRM